MNIKDKPLEDRVEFLEKAMANHDISLLRIVETLNALLGVESS